MELDRFRAPDESHTRVWSLLLLRSLNKAGVTPCSNATFHRAAYFANVLAGIYDFQPPVEVVMRHARGPFYPRIQANLDWHCLVNNCRVEDVSYERKGDVWTRIGIYDITKSGFFLSAEFIEKIEWARDASQFLDDLALAMSLNDDEESTSGIEAQDFTYNRPSSGEAPVINFREFLGNKSLMASEELRNRVPAQLRPIPQKTLRLYLKYLNKMAA